MKKDWNKFYNITSICKDDIIKAFEDIKADELKLLSIKKKVEYFDGRLMKWIASRMAEEYLECCYWDTLRAIVENYLLESKNG